MITSFPFHPLELAASAAAGLGLLMLGLTRLRPILFLYALQTLGLGTLAVLIGFNRNDPELIAAGLAVAILKGIAVPLYLAHVAEESNHLHDKGLFISPALLMVLSLTGLGIFLLGGAADRVIPSTLLPGMIQLVLGMLLMITRRSALSQLIGFLVLENGVFLYSISQPVPLPLIVELGALLDLLAGTMVAGVLIFRIKKHFDHIDVTALKELRG